MSEKERDLVFERFYRILRDGASGSGLGLAIVREIANSHNAKVEVKEGTDGIGTCFTVTFPEINTNAKRVGFTNQESRRQTEH